MKREIAYFNDQGILRLVSSGHSLSELIRELESLDKVAPTKATAIRLRNCKRVAVLDQIERVVRGTVLDRLHTIQHLVEELIESAPAPVADLLEGAARSAIAQAISLQDHPE